ncbi:hypothetical protein PILCRDRAFT_238903 [Piloderma croceum F 1598]|uniref:EF-hand domain-containing protein n=1 Tax=Piloderma croceum (strain F 1598) TaxID=765440 RepID=A0A0C3FX30_PILCF|nr:hypothetical protein PILCRDRAFT_238903 [Piloderma croceum F 1598]
MKPLTSLSLLFLPAVLAHQDHGKPEDGPTNYAEQHMAKEHHIDSFDPESFFQLHDLNQDGVWDREEVEAIYGVHHVYSQKKSKDDVDHQKKADYIAQTILDLMDKDKDGKITLAEFTKFGYKGLPSFDNIGAEGHHYDVESEFFLHHEEEFHSTPETQTDESYNHPEDIEHFAQHEAIELKEAEKEAKFQGITVEEALKQHEEPSEGQATHPPPGTDPQFVQQPGGDNANAVPQEPPAPDPAVKFKDAGKAGASKEEWGAGDAGYKSPSSPSDKMRKNLPYKVKSSVLEFALY